MPTHEVFNVPPPWTGANLYGQDRALVHATRILDADEQHRLAALGARAGGAEAQEWGRLANVHPPELRTFDRYGHRIDEVEFHPSWHQLMTVAAEPACRPRRGRTTRPSTPTWPARPASSCGARSKPGICARSR